MRARSRRTRGAARRRARRGRRLSRRQIGVAVGLGVAAAAALVALWLMPRQPSSPLPDIDESRQEALLREQEAVREALRAEAERGIAEAPPPFPAQSAEGLFAAREAYQPAPEQLPVEPAPQAPFVAAGEPLPPEATLRRPAFAVELQRPEAAGPDRAAEPQSAPKSP